MKPLEDAQREVLFAIHLLPEVMVSADEAVGLVLTQDLRADQDLPPFPNSAMDGYAVRAADVSEVPVTLPVAGEAAAGHPSARPLEPGTAVRIMTGAPIPAGGDTVVKVEDTQPGDGVVLIEASAPLGTAVRPAGSDVRNGELVVRAGSSINLHHRGLLAALGIGEVSVRRRPRVAIMSTGDEVLDETAATLGAGQIRDTNRPMLMEAVRQVGGIPLDIGVVPDERAALRQTFLDAADQSDLVISSGGVSMGDYDLVKRILAETGGVEFWKVAMKPAKPFAFGRIGTTPFFGLPGNPVSVMVAFEQFARPALLKMMGARRLFRPRIRGILGAEVATDPAKTVFLRMSVSRDSDGTWTARPAGEQGSHVLSGLAAADAFAVIHRGWGSLPVGAAIDLEMFRWPASRTVEEALG